MSENEKLSDEAFWIKKIREHRYAFIALIIAAVCAITGVLLTLFWVIEENPFVNPRTGTFNDWTLNYVVGFIILTILWELLFVGVPSGLFFGLGGYLWWRRLPEEEKEEFKTREKKEKERKGVKRGGGGGGFGIVMFIAYCIYIGIDGYYNKTFGSRPFTYWIYSWFLTLMWMVIVLGIPAAIILLIVYFKIWRKK
ncbi:MAG: HMG-box domain-containing protein [Promethearchaeota archaeon]